MINPRLALILSVLVYFIILIACFFTVSPRDPDIKMFFILFIVCLFGVPIAQYKLSHSLTASGKKELGSAITKSIFIELIILVAIIFFLNVYK
ncbi:MAG: hypothetical protein KF900_00580 [Bacteroidetes bacterium]|nr:hypothetical protein [Bacteroidota bacterium]